MAACSSAVVAHCGGALNRAASIRNGLRMAGLNVLSATGIAKQSGFVMAGGLVDVFASCVNELQKNCHVRLVGLRGVPTARRKRMGLFLQ